MAFGTPSLFPILTSTTGKGKPRRQTYSDLFYLFWTWRFFSDCLQAQNFVWPKEAPPTGTTPSPIARDGFRMQKKCLKISILTISIECSLFRSPQESSTSPTGGRESFLMTHKDSFNQV